MKLAYSNIKKSPKYYPKYYSNTASSYCSYCGNKYNSMSWPKACACCNNIIYRNPIPVAVGLLPFATNNTIGLLLVERAIKPYFGELCLPGGFVDWSESWQEAIRREIFEETSVETSSDEFSLADVYSTPDATRILIFGASTKIRTMDELRNFEPGYETRSVLIGTTETNLCFSLHQKVYNNWFIQNNRLE